MELKHNFEGTETRRFKIDEKWDRAGEEGEYFGLIWVGDRKWAIILFDGEEDPDLHKAESLLIEQKSYYTLNSL